MTVQSIERVFDILELLSKEQNGLQLTEIGRRLDLHKSTVYRLLAVLRKRGYIEKSESTNRYRIGAGFIELSSMYLNNVELKTEAAPYLRKLSQMTKETVFLAMIQDTEVVYLDKFEQFSSLRKYSVIGQRRPIYCTSLGKAMIMHRSEEEIVKLFEGVVFERFTEKTIRDVPALLVELEKCRARGWTMDDEEYEPGVQCIGAPLLDYRGTAIAAISVVWSMYNSKVNPEELAGYVVDIASSISKRLGYSEKRTARRAGEKVKLPF